VKILLVHNFYQQPGGEDIVFEQEREVLRRAGHTVISYERSNWEADSYTGLRKLQLAARTIWSENTRQQFAQLLNRQQPDVVHVHNTFTMISPSIFFACKEANTPVVKTLHNYRLCCPAGTFFRDGHPCEDCMDKNLWCSVSHGCYRHSRAATATVAIEMAVHRLRDTWTRNVDCYIALTEFARRKFLRAGLPADRLFVKPNFVDPDPGMRGNGEGHYALFVGRLSEERVRTLLAAWSLLRTRRIPLVIIGNGPHHEGLREYTRRSGLDHISFLGHRPREKVLAAMHDARFLVFPSEWYENFPVTIAESFACGVPVVCSRIGAMQEIVQDGHTGLNFASGDPADLAAKVEWAWDHPQQLRTLGAQGRREYEAKYTAEKNYPVLMEIYRAAMRRKALKGCELIPENEGKLAHAAGPHS
jgi:glycosyltransferase involved in cell wall biosynthesis